MVCLASRRLRKIAQPVLWRQVVLDDGDKLERFLSSTALTSHGKHTRFYTVEPDIWANKLDWDILLGVTGVLPAIIELRIRGRTRPALEPRLLLSHENMRRLALRAIHLPPGSLPCLPQLEQLSLWSIRTTTEVMRSWICPEHMSSLCVLQIRNVTYDDGARALLQELVAAPMLAQLDVVRVTSRDLHQVSQMAPTVELAKTIAPPVLVNSSKLWTASRARHTLFSLSPDDDALAVVRRIVDIALDSSIVVVSPSAILNPESLRASDRTARLPDRITSILRRLDAQCAAKGVRIIWYDDDYPHDLVPPEFLRYARELKAERRAREQEEQERRA